MKQANYQYQVRDLSLLAPCYRAALWNPLVAMMPPRVSPNALTLAGNVSLWAAVVALLTMPCQSRAAMTIGAVGVFVYFTLDSIDGLHARRVGKTSVLGELLDHWLDVWDLGLLAIGLPSFLCCTVEARLLVMLACSLGMFAVLWEHYHTGLFPVSRVGANELLTAISLLLAAGACWGAKAVTSPALGKLAATDVFWALVVTGFAWVIAQTVQRHGRTAIDVAVFAMHQALLALWYLAGSADGRWVLAAMLLIHAMFCGRVILCRLRQIRFVAFHPIASFEVATGMLLALGSAPAVLQTGFAQFLVVGLTLQTLYEFATSAAVIRRADAARAGRRTDVFDSPTDTPTNDPPRGCWPARLHSGDAA